MSQRDSEAAQQNAERRKHRAILANEVRAAKIRKLANGGCAASQEDATLLAAADKSASKHRAVQSAYRARKAASPISADQMSHVLACNRARQAAYRARKYSSQVSQETLARHRAKQAGYQSAYRARKRAEEDALAGPLLVRHTVTSILAAPSQPIGLPASLSTYAAPAATSPGFTWSLESQWPFDDILSRPNELPPALIRKLEITAGWNKCESFRLFVLDPSTALFVNVYSLPTGAPPVPSISPVGHSYLSTCVKAATQFRQKTFDWKSETWAAGGTITRATPHYLIAFPSGAQSRADDAWRRDTSCAEESSHRCLQFSAIVDAHNRVVAVLRGTKIIQNFLGHIDPPGNGAFDQAVDEIEAMLKRRSVENRTLAQAATGERTDGRLGSVG